MNKFPWLEIAESLALFGSVVGTVMAVISGKIIFCATPLSLSLLLNLTNRYRFEQQTRIKTLAAIMLVDQDLFRVKESIHKLQQQQGVLEETIAPIKTQVEELTEKFNARYEIQQIEELKETLTNLANGVALIQLQLYQYSNPTGSSRVPNPSHQIPWDMESKIPVRSLENLDGNESNLVWGDITKGVPRWDESTWGRK